MEHVENAQKAYLESSHKSKMEFMLKILVALSIFCKKLGVWLGSKYAAFRESLRKCNF